MSGVMPKAMASVIQVEPLTNDMGWDATDQEWQEYTGEQASWAHSEGF